MKKKQLKKISPKEWFDKFYPKDFNQFICEKIIWSELLLATSLGFYLDYDATVNFINEKNKTC